MTKPKQARKTLSENTGKSFAPFFIQGGGTITEMTVLSGAKFGQNLELSATGTQTDILRIAQNWAFKSQSVPDDAPRRSKLFPNTSRGHYTSI